MMPGLSPLRNKQVALFGKQKLSILYFKVFSIKRVIPWRWNMAIIHSIVCLIFHKGFLGRGSFTARRKFDMTW